MTSSGILLYSGTPRTEANHGWPAIGIFSFGWACIVLLVVAFELHAGAVEVWLLAMPVLACLFLLQLSAPAMAVSLLAAPLLLGPIARIALPGGLLLHIGDIAIGVMAVGSIARQGNASALRLGEYEIPILLVVAFALVSWIAGLDPMVSTPSMVALLEMLALYIFTTAAVTSSRDVDAIILGWVGAVTLGSLLILVAYLRHEPLLIGSGVDAQHKAASAIESTTSLYRATFFVTGFGYPLAAVILCSALWLIARKGSSKLRVSLGGGLILNVVAMGLLGGATVGGAVAIGLILLAFWVLWLPNGVRRVMLLGIVFLLSAGAIVLAITHVMSAAQLKLLLGRTQSASSLFERFKVWKNVVAYLLTYPHAMLIGLGPDISIRTDFPVVRRLFNGAGVQQNAVDSGYLYLLLNYGIFVTLLVVGMAISTLTRLTKMITTLPEPTVIALWVSIAVWMVMAVTQQGGVSKPLFITAQFAALATALHAISARQFRFQT